MTFSYAIGYRYGIAVAAVHGSILYSFIAACAAVTSTPSLPVIGIHHVCVISAETNPIEEWLTLALLTHRPKVDTLRRLLHSRSFSQETQTVSITVSIVQGKR